MLLEFLSGHWLDLFTTLLGLLYIWLEYRANIWLWVVGIIMPALDIYLYYSHGLYGDAGMAVYYTLAAIYGFLVWRFGLRFLRKNDGARSDTKERETLTISHMPLRMYLPVATVFFVVWGLTHWVLVRFTDSTVPILDAFTNALSIVGLWALSRKYIEQWLFWIVVDAVCCYLYVVKGIPFKALLYGLYVFIAILGWRRWKREADAHKA